MCFKLLQILKKLEVTDTDYWFTKLIALAFKQVGNDIDEA
jgi:hypothetical protein